ncbi:zinc finger protein 853 [Cyclospora cayetanensis]|uniref:Zinc finger protein 853 n=1 Tax=Cyclospora cayetanensis TaxID=88456 RepID=A0A6P6S1A7_9EIME|nr:zinc finger protein 853 [Cyclospora cayetanensis]
MHTAESAADCFKSTQQTNASVQKASREKTATADESGVLLLQEQRRKQFHCQQRLTRWLRVQQLLLQIKWQRMRHPYLQRPSVAQQQLLLLQQLQEDYEAKAAWLAPVWREETPLAARRHFTEFLVAAKAVADASKKGASTNPKLLFLLQLAALGSRAQFAAAQRKRLQQQLNRAYSQQTKFAYSSVPESSIKSNPNTSTPLFEEALRMAVRQEIELREVFAAAVAQKQQEEQARYHRSTKRQQQGTRKQLQEEQRQHQRHGVFGHSCMADAVRIMQLGKDDAAAATAAAVASNNLSTVEGQLRLMQQKQQQQEKQQLQLVQQEQQLLHQQLAQKRRALKNASDFAALQQQLSGVQLQRWELEQQQLLVQKELEKFEKQHLAHRQRQQQLLRMHLNFAAAEGSWLAACTRLFPSSTSWLTPLLSQQEIDSSES